MKKLLLILLVAVGCAPAAKQVKHTTFEYELVDTLNGSKSELYVKIYEWVAKNYNDANNVIKMSDKEAGKIIVKASIAVPGMKGTYGELGKDHVHYTLVIDIKDSKYRCVFSDFYHKGGVYTKSSGCNGGNLDNNVSNCQGLEMSSNRWQKIKEVTSSDIEASITDLKKYMRHSSKDF